MKTAFFLLALVAFVASETYVIPGSQAYINDNNVLQYALTLENLENAFYTQALATFSSANFTAAGFNSTVRDLVTIIGQHESTHVQALGLLLISRGATPVAPCSTYNFNFTTLGSFLATAQALEAAGVSAYDGAIASLTQSDLIPVAAGVAAVEARHSAFINRLVGVNPFANYTDLAISQSIITALAAGFFPVNCTQVGSLATIVPADNLRNVSAYNQTVFNQTAAFLNDNNVIQYALTLEHLENAFYTTALNSIAKQYFTVLGVSDIDYAYIQLIAAQEAAHVAYLSAALVARSAVPVSPCTYNFAFPNSTQGVALFMQNAISLEAVGTSAYIGAANLLTSESILTVAATIATVEARHTSYLRYLFGNLTNNAGGNVPFPDAVDAAFNASFVLSQAAPFIVNPSTCVNFTLPVSANLFRPNVTAITSSSSTSAGSSTSASSSTSGSASSRGSSSSAASSTRSSSASGSGSSTRISTTTSARSPADSLIVSMGVVLAALALAF